MAELFAKAAWKYGFSRGPVGGVPDLHDLELGGFFAARPIFAQRCPFPCRVYPTVFEATAPGPDGERAYMLQFQDVADDWGGRPPVGGYIDDNKPLGTAVPLTTSGEWCEFFVEEIFRSYVAGQNAWLEPDGECPEWPGWSRSFLWVMNRVDSIPRYREDCEAALYASALPPFDPPLDVPSDSSRPLLPAAWEVYPGSVPLDTFWPHRDLFQGPVSSVVLSSSAMIYG